MKTNFTACFYLGKYLTYIDSACYNWHINQFCKKGGLYIARRYNSEESRRRILSACVKLFIEKGYHSTTVAEILKEADVTSSTFQNIFRTKDGVLSELTEFMFSNQFASARIIAKENLSPVYVYAVETSIQLALTEINENLRDIYVEAYSYPETAGYIHRHTAQELHKIFSSYLPECSESDFYEMEIGTSGIMCSYMAKKCDMYFTLEKKISRFLAMSMSAYNVPKEEQKNVMDYVMRIDIRKTANAVMHKLFESLAMRYEFELEM